MTKKLTRLTDEQRKQLVDDSAPGGSEIVPISFDDKIIETPLLFGEFRRERARPTEASSYQLTTTLGDYSTTVGFPDEASMRRHIEKQKPGLWYDWQSGESNDPNWGAMQDGARLRGAKLRDAKTGEQIRRVYFYHAGTHYLERAALASDGLAVVCRDGETGVGCEDVARIVETRELWFESPNAIALPSNPDAVVELGPRLTDEQRKNVLDAIRRGRGRTAEAIDLSDAVVRDAELPSGSDEALKGEISDNRTSEKVLDADAVVDEHERSKMPDEPDDKPKTWQDVTGQNDGTPTNMDKSNIKDPKTTTIAEPDDKSLDLRLSDSLKRDMKQAEKWLSVQDPRTREQVADAVESCEGKPHTPENEAEIAEAANELGDRLWKECLRDIAAAAGIDEKLRIVEDVVKAGNLAGAPLTKQEMDQLIEVVPGLCFWGVDDCDVVRVSYPSKGGKSDAQLDREVCERERAESKKRRERSVANHKATADAALDAFERSKMPDEPDDKPKTWRDRPSML